MIAGLGSIKWTAPISRAYGPNLPRLFVPAQGSFPSSGRTSLWLSVFLWVVGVWRGVGAAVKEVMLQVRSPAVATCRPNGQTP